MIRRQREIISIILNTDGFITGNELAKQCGITARTIRFDIKDINNSLKEYGTKINSVVKKGYCLDNKGKNIMKENNIIRSVLDNEYISEIPNIPFERQMYLISKLIIEEYISVDDLADKLHVSVSTINQDINFARKWLKGNLGFNFNNSLTKGIKLNVTEKQKRNIISWILSYKLNASTLAKHWNYLFEEELKDHAEKLYHVMKDVTRQYGYFLSGHSSQLFCVEIIVAIRRNQLGYYIEESENINDELKPVIVTLREEIQSYMNVTLSKAEWLNLQQFFLSKQFISGTSFENIKSSESVYIVNEFLKKLKNKYKVDLLEYPVVKDKLVLYVTPMINRLRYRHCIGNKIRENVSEIHKLEFKMASEISEILSKELNLIITLDELNYITIYLSSTQNIWRKKLNAIIVCDYDESVISYIKDRIAYSINDKISISECYTYQQFILGKKEKIKNVDFIIATSTLADKTDIPFAIISPIMEQKDINNLYQYIDSLEENLIKYSI